MKMRKFIIIVVIFLLVISSFFFDNYKAKYKAAVHDISIEAISYSIPDEIYNAIKIKFPYIESKGQITYMNTRLNPDGEGEIALFSTVDRLNGFFVLFQKENLHYKEVYVKEKPVYSVEVTSFTSPNQIIFSSGMGGTGVQDNKFHIIRYTPKGYSDVWNGIGTSIRFTSAPYIRIDGCVKTLFGNPDELIYFQLKRTYEYNNNNFTLISKENTVQNFKYNEQKMKYEVVVKKCYLHNFLLFFKDIYNAN